MEFLIWAVMLGGLLSLLLAPMNENSSIFSTNYTLSLLMPVMLWGAMRFGYKLMSIIWTPVLLVSIHYYYRYIPLHQGYDIQLAITSSSYLVFSFVVIYMSMLATRQRAINIRSRRLALLDPVVHMPNLRALSRDLAKNPWSALCLLRIPELEVWGVTMACCCAFSTNKSWRNGLMARSSPMSGFIILPAMIWPCA
jgi:hypothetical protein